MSATFLTIKENTPKDRLHYMNWDRTAGDDERKGGKDLEKNDKSNCY